MNEKDDIELDEAAVAEAVDAFDEEYPGASLYSATLDVALRAAIKAYLRRAALSPKDKEERDAASD